MNIPAFPENKTRLLLLILVLVFVAFVAIFRFTPLELDLPGGFTPLRTKTTEPKPLAPTDEIKLQEQVSELIKSKDFNRCTEVKNDMYRKVCVNNIAMAVAGESGDPKICDRMDGGLMSRSDCLTSLVYTRIDREKTDDACNLLEREDEKTFCKEQFLWEQIFSATSTTVCDMLSDEVKNQCLDSFVTRKLSQADTKTFSKKISCDALKSEAGKKDCKQIEKNLARVKSTSGVSSPLAGLQSSACRGISSRVFTSFCVSFRNMTTPPKE